MIHDKKILITGGAGFMGVHLAERLAAANEVTLLDIDLANSLPYSPLDNDSRVRKVCGDVCDADLIDEEVSKAQIVLHLASLVGVKKVIDNARQTIDTIFFGTGNVLEAARHNPRIERIVYISTSEVYGNIMNASEGAQASVGTDNDPRLSYASAKLMGEHQVWAYHRDFNLPTVIIRPFNIFGPKRKTSNAVSVFVVKAIANEDLVLHGDGSQLRSWCYIADYCDGVLAAAEKPAAVGQDFNLGNPVTANTIYDLAQRIIRLSGSRSQLVTTAHTFSDIGVRAPQPAKARELLGYNPTHDLDAGLIPTIQWFRENFDEFSHWLTPPKVSRVPGWAQPPACSTLGNGHKTQRDAIPVSRPGPRAAVA